MNNYQSQSETPTPNLALGTGITDGVTLAEATQTTGVVTVTGETNHIVTVKFVGTLGTIVKTLTATGAAQPVVLTDADVSILGDGLVIVEASQKDLTGNVGDSSWINFTIVTIGTPAIEIMIAAVNYLHYLNNSPDQIREKTCQRLSVIAIQDIIQHKYPYIPPRPSPTPTPTTTSTCTPTRSPRPTPTQTSTLSPTPTPSASASPTATPSNTAEPTPSPTETSAPTPTPTSSITPTVTPTVTPAVTQSPSFPSLSPSPSSFSLVKYRRKGKGTQCDPYILPATELSSMTVISLDAAFSGKLIPYQKNMKGGSITTTIVRKDGTRIVVPSAFTPIPTTTPTVTPTVTQTMTPSASVTPTPTLSPTPTTTVTNTHTPAETVTPSVTHTVTPTQSASPSPTPTVTSTITPSLTPSPTSAGYTEIDNCSTTYAIEWLLLQGLVQWEIMTLLGLSLNTFNRYLYVRQFVNTPIPTESTTPTRTPTPEPTSTPTPTPPVTPTVTKTPAPSPTPTKTPPVTKSQTPALSPSATATPPNSPSPTPNPTPTMTQTPEPTLTTTPSPTVSPTVSLSANDLSSADYVSAGDTIEIVCVGEDCPPGSLEGITSPNCVGGPIYSQARIELIIDSKQGG